MGRGFVGAFKSLGDAGWEGIYSNIFWDRDRTPKTPKGERFTLAGHKEFASWVNEDPAERMPELRFWHLDNMVLGKAHTLEVFGPFSYVAGSWGEDAKGQKAKEYFSGPESEETVWAMSHGYKYRLVDWNAGEFQRYRTDEVTVLPEKWAANLITAFSEGTKMTLKDDLKNALGELFGLEESDAEKVIAEGTSKKELGEGEASGQKDEETTPTEPAAEEEVTDDQMAEALGHLITLLEKSDGDKKEILDAVKQLSDRVSQLETNTNAAVKELRDEADARKQVLPAAVKRALEHRIKSLSEEGKVTPEKVTEDMTSQGAKITGKKDFSADPISWFADQAGLE